MKHLKTRLITHISAITMLMMLQTTSADEFCRDERIALAQCINKYQQINPKEYKKKCSAIEKKLKDCQN